MSDYVVNESELEQISAGGYVGPVFRYTIQWGDTLSQLAVRFGTTVSVLQQINGIANPDKIYAGKTLYIPYKQ